MNPILNTIVELMQIDNGVFFIIENEHIERANKPTSILIKHGYFEEQLTISQHIELESSFFHAAMGEESETRYYFSKCPEAWDEMHEILNDIFENPKID